ncbi:MAG: TonB-dependent receptor [Bacteroidia bacterium]
MRALFLSFIICTGYIAKAQTIKIVDSVSNEPIIGCHIALNNLGIGVTNILGEAKLELKTGIYQLEISHISYKTRTVKFNSKPKKETVYKLQANDVLLGELVITGSKYEVSTAQSPITVDVIKPDLIKRNNANTADAILKRIPGVEIIDGQANIRGGSGYSYGAGSRVLVLLDGIPILQADAGFPQWNDLPIELVGQIEVLKGASSSLYGSSALNGIIHLRTDYAKSEPETGFFTYATGFSKPLNQAWWGKNETPNEFGFGLYHKQKINKTDLVLGVFSKNLISFNKFTSDDYKRLSGSVNHKPNERLSLGFNFNANLANNSEFFFWKSLDSLFVPSNGTVSTVAASRFNIDPRLTFYDNSNNRHRILTRYHFVNNETNAGRSNASQLFYSEYQFYRKIAKLNGNVSAGLVNTMNSISAELYGDTSFSTTNSAAYLQYDQSIYEKLKVTIGARYESNTLRAPEYFNCRKNPFTGETICDTIPNGRKQEARPVFRIGTNYQAAKYTFIRASWGQGYRYPTVAEQFIKTTFGGILISPNVNLRSETGWSAEVGIKQGIGVKKYKGFLDLSFYLSQYQNMMEFNFIDLTTTGFQSVNIGNTQIKGFELSWMGELKSNAFSVSHLMGYNYVDPKFAEFDTIPVAEPTSEGQINFNNSSSSQNILKYRFKHTFKYDIEFKYKKWGLGTSANFYSHMQAVDAIFEAFVVPGLKDFREENNAGVFISNFRLSYRHNQHFRFSFLANNAFNKQYSLRPGLMEAPRNFSLRLDVKI